jgi:hypothetical protein
LFLPAIAGYTSWKSKAIKLPSEWKAKMIAYTLSPLLCCSFFPGLSVSDISRSLKVRLYTAANVEIWFTPNSHHKCRWKVEMEPSKTVDQQY